MMPHLSLVALTILTIAADKPKKSPEAVLTEWLDARVKTALDLSRSFCPLISETDAALARSDTLALFAAATANESAVRYSYAAAFLNLEQLLAQLEKGAGNNELAYRYAKLRATASRYLQGEEQLEILGKVQEEARTLVVESGDLPKYRVLYAWTTAMIADGCESSGRFQEAIQHYEIAIKQWEAAITLGGESANYRVGLAYACNGSGGAYFANRDFEKARKMYDRALELRLKLAEEFPAQGCRLVDVGGSTCNVANVLLDGARKFDEAASRYDKAITLLERARKMDPDVREAQNYLASSHFGKFVLLVRQKKFAEADKSFEAAIDLMRPDDVKFRKVVRSLEIAEAGEHRRAIADLDKVVGKEEIDSSILFHVATVYAAAHKSATDDPKLAESYAQSAIKHLGALRSRGAFQNKNVIKNVEDHPVLKALSKHEDYQRFIKEIKDEATKSKE